VRIGPVDGAAEDAAQIEQRLWVRDVQLHGQGRRARRAREGALAHDQPHAAGDLLAWVERAFHTEIVLGVAQRRPIFSLGAYNPLAGMTSSAHRAGDWDARSYHQVARPHAGWGVGVLDRANLQGHERVLDAGCGSGRVTAQLLERLPHGHVVAADVSPAMLAEARSTLARWADRVTFLEADLTEIDQHLHQPVEVVFSTAVFHWIADHPKLFRALYAVLEPGGRLVAQCGGGSNLQRFMQATDAVAARPPYHALLDGRALWRFYAGPEQSVERLHSAGFSDAFAWLEPSPQSFPSAAALADFGRAVVLTNHVESLPVELRDDFVAAVVDEIYAREGAYTLDYVRLNLEALRAT
jgi:trans-aconitate 2-methyltransferase